MSENLPKKIKQLREAAELQPGDLAQAAGIETSQYQLIEDGKASPSISTLIKISRRLGVRLGTLLDGDETCKPVVTNPNMMTQTVNTSKAGSSAHLDFFSLASHKCDRNMEPFFVNVKYTANERANYSTHEGEEFIYVLEGRLDIFYGSEKYELGAGESIYYDSIVPHLVTTPVEGEITKIVAVTYTPN